MRSSKRRIEESFKHCQLLHAGTWIAGRGSIQLNTECRLFLDTTMKLSLKLMIMPPY